MPPQEKDNDDENKSCSQAWTRTLQTCTKPIIKPFLKISHHAATHPKLYIAGTIVLSIALMVIGIATNFTSETDDDIWTPRGSRPVEHGDWIDDKSNFPIDQRAAVLIVHRDGKSIFGDDGNNNLALQSAGLMFDVLEEFRGTPRYDELCQYTDYIHPTDGSKTCEVVGASTFWNDTFTIFEEQATSDEVVLETMSADSFPYGGSVDHDQLIGFNKFENDLLVDGLSYVTVVLLPPDKEDVDGSKAFTKDFEEDAIDRMKDLQKAWKDDGSDFKVEFIVDRSFEDEFGRAVTNDLPLLPVVFVLMSILCIIIFSRRDKVLSRGWLGFGAVCTVLLAITASFGLLFVIGVPFTSLTPLLPFIMFG